MCLVGCSGVVFQDVGDERLYQNPDANDKTSFKIISFEDKTLTVLPDSLGTGVKVPKKTDEFVIEGFPDFDTFVHISTISNIKDPKNNVIIQYKIILQEEIPDQFDFENTIYWLRKKKRVFHKPFPNLNLGSSYPSHLAIRKDVREIFLSLANRGSYPCTLR